MNKPREYVCGFMFDPERKSVVLIRKENPSWQQGLLNGVGGKIDSHLETSHSAMSREFWEETGVRTEAHAWRHFATLTDTRTGAVVHFLETSSGAVLHVKSTTKERVSVHKLTLLHKQKLVNSLAWLIPLACDSTKSITYTFSTTNLHVKPEIHT